jgi:MFS family permease
MPKPTARNPWLALALVCLPVFIGALDLTIVSAFLPEIIVGLKLPVQTVIDDAAWVVNGYLLAYTVSMMFMGRVSDLIGRRKTYIACLLIFIVGSIIVAEADPEAQTGLANLIFRLEFRLQGFRPDPGSVALVTIIIGRVVQALGAGALVPISLALVGDLFPPNRRAQPLGIIGAVDTLGWVLGHLYGGILVNHFSENREGYLNFFRSIGLAWEAPDWRALFWINVPITVIALVVTWWVLRGTPQKRAEGRFDFVGTFMIVGALVALVVGLGANIEIASGSTNFEDIGGLPPYAAPVLGLALLLFVGFILVERRVRDPLFDLNMFKRRNLSAGLLTNLFVGFCLMIGLVSVPILVNIRVADATVLAEAALRVGILLSALTVPMAVAAIPGGWLSERFGYRSVAGGGLALALVGFLMIGLTWNYDIPETTVVLHMALVGIGLGLTFSPISAAVINSADSNRLGAASALVIILRLVGMTLSVSILTTLASKRLAFLVAERTSTTNMADAATAIDTYARATVQVLAEIGLLGAAVCAVALIPAFMLSRHDERERPTVAQEDAMRETWETERQRP